MSSDDGFVGVKTGWSSSIFVKGCSFIDDESADEKRPGSSETPIAPACRETVSSLGLSDIFGLLLNDLPENADLSGDDGFVGVKAGWSSSIFVRGCSFSDDDSADKKADCS